VVTPADRWAGFDAYAWLCEKLRDQGLNSPEQVFLAVIDSQGKIYIDGYTDHVPPTDNPSDYPGPN